MVSNAQIAPMRFERHFSDELSIDDVSKIELSRLKDKILLNKDYTLEYHLEKLSLLRQGRFTNAAEIILANNPAMRHPQSRVKVVRYVDNGKNKYQVCQTFAGPLLQLFDELLNYIITNTSTTQTVYNNNTQNQMLYQYPIKAIKEGLINAFAHRDYVSYGSGIKVEISSKKLSIWNSGSLPLGVLPQSLNNGQISILRNPDIANYLKFQGYMDILGRGCLLIKEECKKANLPKPKWQADKTGVILTLFAPTSPIPKS